MLRHIEFLDLLNDVLLMLMSGRYGQEIIAAASGNYCRQFLVPDQVRDVCRFKNGLVNDFLFVFFSAFWPLIRS